MIGARTYNRFSSELYDYDHTQTAPMYLLIFLPAIALAVIGFILRGSDPVLPSMLLAVGAAMVVVAFSFRQLNIRDEGDTLAIRFGPIPIFRKRVNYADIAEIARDKTNWLDGWGIHWVPLRGRTYNLWGFDCVRLTLHNGRTIRIGTDEPDRLAAFVQRKCHRS